MDDVDQDEDSEYGSEYYDEESEESKSPQPRRPEQAPRLAAAANI